MKTGKATDKGELPRISSRFDASRVRSGYSRPSTPKNEPIVPPNLRRTKVERSDSRIGNRKRRDSLMVDEARMGASEGPAGIAIVLIWEIVMNGEKERFERSKVALDPTSPC